MARTYIGTSGFMYQHWKGIFYPQDLPKYKWLEHYCQHFRTVEINASFYHLPKRKTFENWRKRVGKSFVFSIKGSRFITHVKKLKDCQEAIERFFEAVNGIKNSKDVVLWQLPPGLRADNQRLKDFLELLPKNYRYAIEFRNETWLNKELFGVLRGFGVAVVFQDFPHWPITEKVTADFVYIRLHGKRELYASSYTKKELEDWAKKIKGWLRKNLDVYLYFNNDMRGYAVKNAKELKKMVE